MKERTKELAFVEPLILTLTLDGRARAWFDEMRRRHFPPERLFVGAHVTMFHALPGREITAIRNALAASANSTPAFPIACTGLRFLGRGVAFSLASPQATRLRTELATTFAAWLTRQDRAKWQPHITVQNKVSPETARQTLAALASRTPPAPIAATGLALWRYLDGPWENLENWSLSTE